MMSTKPIGNPIIGIQAMVGHSPWLKSRTPVAVPMMIEKNAINDKPIADATI